MNKAITFGELQVGQPLFYINPLNAKISHVNIKKIIPHDKLPHYIKIIYYAPSTNEPILIDNNPDLDDLPTIALIVKREEDLIITTSKVPTIFSTDKGKIEEWMNRS